MNEVSAEDISRREGQGYRPGELIGRTGTEHAWESYLRGQHGYRRVRVDVHGRVQHGGVDDPAEVDERPAVPGHDITLALEMELMRSVERAFRGHPSGAAVVLEVNTGRIRALFSKPSYDLNEMSGRLTTPRFQELQDNPFRPLIDKTVYESYFPGSTFKPITALAFLGTDAAEPSERIHCPGYYEVGNRRFRCGHVHGDVDLGDALVQSCNVYFWRVAEGVGLEGINDVARLFGLGQPTGVGINSEASGFLASREWYERHHGNRFRVGYTLNTAIGQGNTRVTLLQLAAVYAAIANGGTLYVPQVVERLSTAEGDTVETFPPRVRRRIDVDPEHFALIRRGLFGVVNHPDGTGYGARLDGGVVVAGKTGTAEVTRRRPEPDEDPRRTWYLNRSHAWFAGFAPADAPQLAIVVLVEHGGAGGRAAAPIATQILSDYLSGQAEAAGELQTPSSSGVLASRRDGVGSGQH
jgi:penicillin-binding protein 2